MYRKCVTEISVQHQKRVAQSLLELMQKMPFEDISVTQLCQAAGVSRRVFYHLFNNKTDALYALIDHAILETESYHTENPDQALRFFQYWREHESLLTALTDNRMTSLLLERMVDIIVNEDYDIRYWLRTDNTKNGKDILIYSLCGAMGMAYNWYHSGYEKTPEEMAALLVQLLRLPGDSESGSN